MKFKTIFIIFNSVLVFSFLFIFFMPLVLLGGEYFSIFASKNWIAAILFLTTLIIINVYFISNWKLFSLLEGENWPELIMYLEDRILFKSIIRAGTLKMLINAYLITSNTQKIVKLESHVKEKRPSLLKNFALQFGIPYLLKSEPEVSEKYFGRILSEPGVKNRGWIRWNYAFSLMQQKQFEAARVELLNLFDSSRDPLLKLLTLYMLDSYSGSDPELEEKIRRSKIRLKEQYSEDKWREKINRGSKNMQVIILSQIIRDATRWLFNSKLEEKSSQEKKVH